SSNAAGEHEIAAKGDVPPELGDVFVEAGLTPKNATRDLGAQALRASAGGDQGVVSRIAVERQLKLVDAVLALERLGERVLRLRRDRQPGLEAFAHQAVVLGGRYPAEAAEGTAQLQRHAFGALLEQPARIGPVVLLLVVA